MWAGVPPQTPHSHRPVRAPTREAGRTDEGEYWYCTECRHPVTSTAAAIMMAGSHEHGFLNPAGFSFHIGCFDGAPGCREHGAPVPADSWFPGYDWRYALCLGCGTQLGWSYHGRSRFFGLILARLSRAAGRTGGP